MKVCTIIKGRVRQDDGKFLYYVYDNDTKEVIDIIRANQVPLYEN